MSVSTIQKQSLIQKIGKCVECSSSEELTIDHIIPLGRGGYDVVENLQVLCRRCNTRKATRIKWKWYQRIIHALHIDDIVEKARIEMKGEVNGVYSRLTQGFKFEADTRNSALSRQGEAIKIGLNEIKKFEERLNHLEKYLKVEYHTEILPEVKISGYRRIKK